MAFAEDPSDAAIAGLVPSHEELFERFVYQYDPDTSKVVSLMAVSLCLASISVIAALTAFYMFVKMRRAFHHE